MQLVDGHYNYYSSFDKLVLMVSWKMYLITVFLNVSKFEIGRRINHKKIDYDTEETSLLGVLEIISIKHLEGVWPL